MYYVFLFFLDIWTAALQLTLIQRWTADVDSALTNLMQQIPSLHIMSQQCRWNVHEVATRHNVFCWYTGSMTGDVEVPQMSNSFSFFFFFFFSVSAYLLSVIDWKHLHGTILIRLLHWKKKEKLIFSWFGWHSDCRKNQYKGLCINFRNA